MKHLFNKNRFSVLFSFLSIYCLFGFSIRLILFIISFNSVDLSVGNVFKIFSLGFLFDFGTAVFFGLIYALYLLVLPSKLVGSSLDKLATYFILFFTFFITVFSFLAEFPFWDEFSTRFNFIAVDYLIYTYEVVENINQSFPLPLLIIVLFTLTGLLFFYFFKTKKFHFTFTNQPKLKERFFYIIPLVLVSLIFIKFITNKQAETSKNLYVNELSKNGVYSFFAAFRSNELDFNTFYQTLSNEKAFDLVKKEIRQNNQVYNTNDLQNISRKVTNDSIEYRPNIILICVESLSADFMEAFGNKEKLTPFLDSLANESVFFTNLYATGTRTIRGMEALTLSVPPTPGNSIVRRPNNANLYSIASVLKQKEYDLNFIYGGDGYFDNMNTFFGGQGFTIIDRNRGNPLSDDIKTQRINIEDSEVTFENAWGICDENTFSKTIQVADASYKKNKPFFDFIMTTSNHKPYSFPKNIIDFPQGKRESVVRYTDYAIQKFIEEAKTKPWFENTVFVIVADHCASSAGKWELNIDKHHIPAIIYNLKIPAVKHTKLVSQIDIMPTLFGYLNWTYSTSLYGKDVRLMQSDDERALIGNYRTLGMIKKNTFTEINDRKQCNQYHWDATTNQMTVDKTINPFYKDLTISYYQTASERFKSGSMKE
ncbi:LTA synthase family protein [Flavobacterium sp.]|uniref:LTA synthase family protein n=1 Tax=Flavobacterium sp. TaxID=239 RepID=UPI003F69C7C8